MSAPTVPTAAGRIRQGAGITLLASLIGWGLVTGPGRTAVLLGVFAAIVVHEGGHFLAARRCGISASAFAIGFGPRLITWTRRGVEYSIRLLPIGGFVKITGMASAEEVAPELEASTYRAASLPRRLTTVLAGPGTHFVAAWLLLAIGYATVGIPDADGVPDASVGAVGELPGGRRPAYDAGIRAGDVIVAVEGAKVTTFEEVSLAVRSSGGAPITIAVRRDGSSRTVTIAPARVVSEGGTEAWLLGIGPAPVPPVRVGVLGAPGAAAAEAASLTGQTIEALGATFSPASLLRYARTVGGGDVPPPTERFVSPVGMTQLAGVAADEGPGMSLMLLAVINLFFGVFNLLPVLPLDGGHAVVAVYERIRSRRGRRHQVDPARLAPVTYAVFGLMVVLGLSALWLDVTSPLF